ncbi:MAG: hypothetical protein GWP06_19510 [Actinobacteria bacterium]|nr:hypothetical protein [Actinomycetota bacterium]
MNHKSLWTVAVLFFLSIGGLAAEEIGISWEFNQDGNAEGWKLQHSLTDLQVADGMLRATVTGDFAQLVGPNFDLDVSNYGFIQIRMKAFGAESAVLQWISESGLWGAIKFEVLGDSSFHVYEIPAYQKLGWKGRITGIGRITMNANAGSQIEIDYIRITKVGTRPE